MLLKVIKLGLGRRPSGFCTPLVGVIFAAFLQMHLIGCSGPDYVSSTDFSSEQPESLNVSVPFDFAITIYQGSVKTGEDVIKFSDLFDEKKPMVLNFWAAGCPPCRAEMPDLQEAYQQFGNTVNFFGLDVGPLTALGSREEGRALLRDLKITYPSGSTSERAVMSRYGVMGMPTTIFLSSDGEILWTWVGILNEQNMMRLLRELLKV